MLHSHWTSQCHKIPTLHHWIPSNSTFSQREDLAYWWILPIGGVTSGGIAINGAALSSYHPLVSSILT